MTKILGLCMALMLMMAVPTTAQTADSLAAAEVAARSTSDINPALPSINLVLRA